VPHRALRPRVLSFGAGPARPKFHGRCAPRRPGIQLRKYGKAQRRHAGTGSQPVRTRTCVITAPALDERTLPFLLSTQIQEKRHPFLGYVGPQRRHTTQEERRLCHRFFAIVRAVARRYLDGKYV
jgi:hypothetical protein